MKEKMKCLKCNKNAVWFYMPGDDDQNYCDDHVPRGCSCNIYIKEDLIYETEEQYSKLMENPNNLIELLDDKGRKLPCIEYMYDKEGLDK